MLCKGEPYWHLFHCNLTQVIFTADRALRQWKSTLLKILASLLAPTAGQIRFENRDIGMIKAELYRQQVSYCFNAAAVWRDSV